MSIDSLNTSERYHEITTAERAADFVIGTYFGAQVLACRRIRCGIGGHLHVRKLDGNEETIHDVLAGEPQDIAATIVYADSTAEEILVLI